MTDQQLKKTSFSCGDALDITQVEALKARLDSAVAKSNIVELKADKVEKVDTAGLQLFISLIQFLKQKNGHVIWKSPSQSLLEASKFLGVAKQLELEE